MKLLIICSNQFKLPWPVIPYGACCVAEAAKRSGHEVRVLDLCFSKNTEKDIRLMLRDFVPDVVGVSIRNIDNSDGYVNRFFIPEIKTKTILPLKASFKGPIIIGGSAVAINALELLDYFDLEFAAIGDGEGIIVEFLKSLEENRSIIDIEGLVYRDQIEKAKERHRVRNVNSISFPKVHHWIKLSSYQKFDSPLQVQTKRGCSQKCVYCTYNQIEGHEYRLRDPEAIADQIEKYIKETGINHIEITDSTFNIPLDHAKKVLRAITSKKMNLRLRAMGLNPKSMDQELVDLMQRAGFMDVDLGAEAGCDVTLKSLRKNFTKKDVLEAARLLHSKNIPINWYLLLGAPAETEETVRETLDTVTQAANKWDFITIGIGIRVYNNAPIAREQRVKDPQSAHDNFLSPTVFKPAGISLEKISLLCQMAATKNPNFFIYGSEETTPVGLLRSVFFFQKRFFPRMPIWKLQTARNLLLSSMGVNFLKRKRLKKQLVKLRPRHKIITKAAA